ncbi:TetR/AcrR family transcriptional regulator [Silvimonas amylolytica]|uniref:TetR family transcriptional regulator n=1 Tax=Silvimonas amylolytica TaxID=449663 RepID=A0ABQ2PHB0_9NEIS|nr:TetR/AcrR family transcriptional regulator [Silvimonas amylolytica]GGP24965.1 TetR family transcriptional regulator [Silvimonas amylolytica]
MAISDRKERQKAQLRELILDAARDIVVREGFAALSMRKIADAIEYSPATLYLHFENRDAIARAICAAGYADFARELVPAMENEPDPIQRLQIMARSYVAFGLAHPETYRLIFMVSPEYASALSEGNDEERAGEKAFFELVGAFTQLRGTNRLNTELTDLQLAEMLWASLHGIVSLKLTCPLFVSQSAQDLAQQTLQTQLYGLLDAPARPEN